jgi:ketosteroid isomerase-like protein
VIVAAVFDTAQACERAFYAAFESADLEAMMVVWAEHAPLLCIHPGGPPLTTRDTVAESWRRIFESAGGMRFTLSDLRVVEDANLSVRHLRENIHHGPGLRDTALVLASNVFVREAGSWRMCVHHASPGGASVSAGGAVH